MQRIPSASGQSPAVTVFHHNVLLAICATGSVLLIAWLLKYSAYGFDFTDEGFYLNSMAKPFLYDYSHTQFGFIYHPIYQLLGGDVVKLRQANILVTFGLAWGLAYVFLTSLVPKIEQTRSERWIITAGLATSVLLVFHWWLLTPSYNNLNLQAVLMTAIGFVLAEKRIHRASVIGWSLIGMGGWLAFMAKPSTALALAIGILLALWFARKYSGRMLLFAVALSTALVWLSAIWIDGSMIAFAHRIQRAADFGRLLGSEHTLIEALRIDQPSISDSTALLMAWIGIAVGISLLGCDARHKAWRWSARFVPIAFFTITALLTLGYAHWHIGFNLFHGVLILNLVLAALCSSWIAAKRHGLKHMTSQPQTTTYLFFAMPHIYAFGTNGNYWYTGGGGGSAAIFWLLAGLTLLRPWLRMGASWRFLLPMAIATQFVTAMMLKTGFEAPYRQPQALRLNETAVTFGEKASTLMLNKPYATYISDAALAAANHGFAVGTPMIDLSGQSPGLLYALGAESVGQAWNVGAYPGSLALAQAALHRTPCDKIASAWVLFEPNGPRSISSDLMRGVGSAFPSAYARVATWNTASGAGGFTEPRAQELYKPIAVTDIFNGCNRLRNTRYNFPP